jgi:hypothetical protein
MVTKSFDQWYNTCVTISKKWGKNTVPVKLIESTSEILIKNANSIEIKEAGDFKDKYTKLIRNTVKSLKTAAKSMNSSDVPFDVFKNHIKVIKEGFIKGSKLGKKEIE